MKKLFAAILTLGIVVTNVGCGVQQTQEVQITQEEKEARRAEREQLTAELVDNAGKKMVHTIRDAHPEYCPSYDAEIDTITVVVFAQNDIQATEKNLKYAYTDERIEEVKGFWQYFIDNSLETYDYSCFFEEFYGDYVNQLHFTTYLVDSDCTPYLIIEDGVVAYDGFAEKYNW